jgi:FdhE protein
MTIDVQKLIEERPHLKDPLQLYGRWQRFQEAVAACLPKERSALSAEEAKTYPRAKTDEIFQLFVNIFELPAEDFAPLQQALENGDVDFMRLPLGEVPAISALACADEELARLLFLFARPYFQQLRNSYPLDGSQWDNGRCPLCSAPTALASIVEGPKRHLHCSFCGTVGTYRFTGCPNCGSNDSTQLTTIESEDEPGCRVITCDGCRTYVKVIEHPLLKKMGIDLADMASLPLDIVAQEKGFTRTVPNPISLKKMA